MLQLRVQSHFVKLMWNERSVLIANVWLVGGGWEKIGKSPYFNAILFCFSHYVKTKQFGVNGIIQSQQCFNYMFNCILLNLCEMKALFLLPHYNANSQLNQSRVGGGSLALHSRSFSSDWCEIIQFSYTR